MSLSVMQTFFPTLIEYLQTQKPDTYRRMFPIATQRNCPELVWTPFNAFALRWPTLLPLEVLGVLVGLYGFSHLLTRKSASGGTPGWALSFAFFATMNLSAIFCHCLLTPGSPMHQAMVTLDVACTACANLSAIYAVLTRELAPATSSSQRHQPKEPMFPIAVLNLVTLVFAFVFTAKPWAHEVLYIGFTGVAVALVGLQMLLKSHNQQQKAWTVLLFLAGLLGASGNQVDAWLCSTFGPYYGAAHQVFLACDLVYLALILYMKADGARKAKVQ